MKPFDADQQRRDANCSPAVGRMQNKSLNATPDDRPIVGVVT